jgi:hypothetical protein
MAAFISERVAGFKLECLAGFVGIRTTSHLECSYVHSLDGPRPRISPQLTDKLETALLG